MSHHDYKQTFSWQRAIDLSVQLQKLADELPAEESNALAPMLRNSMVEIPARIAFDLVTKIPGDPWPCLRLQSQLEILNRVYPAIDTTEAQDILDDLMNRLISPVSFNEIIPTPAPEPSGDVPEVSEEE